MPPKIKITKEDIIKTAVELVRESGTGALNARTVASALGCSTQPVFSNFATMEALQKAVTLAAYERYLVFLENEAKDGKIPKYKAFGMAYIRFAKEERELFKLLFMCDRRGGSFTPTADFDASVDMIVQANGIDRKVAERLHLEMWTSVHGIGTMLATSFLDLDEELISNMLTDVYQGLRIRHIEEKR